MFFFLTNVFGGSKYCLTLLETVGLPVPNRNIREFSLFNVESKRRNCPSARLASAANGVGSNSDICNVLSVLVNDGKYLTLLGHNFKKHRNL